jgi:glutamate-1-semialdehyde 2,1-aminomutase
VALGGAQEKYGVMPDLTAFGKVIGGGLPVGAYGGSKTIMEHVAPAGSMYQAGTLSGNPLAMAAGLATLRTLTEPGLFERVIEVAATVRAVLEQHAAAAGIPLRTAQAGTMFGLFFNDQPVTNYAEVKTSDAARYAKFFHGLLEQGVYFAPSAFEAAFASSAHAGAALDQTLSALERVFAQL